MSKTLIGYLRKRGEYWSFRLGTNWDSATHCGGFDNIDTAYQKLIENHLNPKSRLMVIVETKIGPIGYEAYKSLVEV